MLWFVGFLFFHLFPHHRRDEILQDFIIFHLLKRVKSAHSNNVCLKYLLDHESSANVPAVFWEKYSRNLWANLPFHLESRWSSTWNWFSVEWPPLEIVKYFNLLQLSAENKTHSMAKKCDFASRASNCNMSLLFYSTLSKGNLEIAYCWISETGNYVKSIWFQIFGNFSVA